MIDSHVMAPQVFHLPANPRLASVGLIKGLLMPVIGAAEILYSKAARQNSSQFLQIVFHRLDRKQTDARVA